MGFIRQNIKGNNRVNEVPTVLKPTSPPSSSLASLTGNKPNALIANFYAKENSLASDLIDFPLLKCLMASGWITLDTAGATLT